MAGRLDGFHKDHTLNGLNIKKNNHLSNRSATRPSFWHCFCFYMCFENAHLKLNSQKGNVHYF